MKGPSALKTESRIEEHVRFAKTLDLFANVVHAFSIPGVNVNKQIKVIG